MKTRLLILCIVITTSVFAQTEALIEKEWLRTNPDAIVYLPNNKEDGDNEHFLVFNAPLSDELLAIWTQSSVEGNGDNRAVFSRSKDGISWQPPVVIAGKGLGRGGNQASWAFPVVSKLGRIYCFFTKEIAPEPGRSQEAGSLGCFYSDDNGYTWIEGADILVPKNKWDNPDPQYTPNWIVWQKPIRDGKGKYFAGYTRWTSEKIVKRPARDWVHQDSRAFFMRFENIDKKPLPQDIKITWLPENGEGLEIPHRDYPSISVAQEPAVVLLPDKRLFTVMRNMTGYIWYSVSDDNGKTWRKPEVLRYNDGGEMIKNPMASCPIYSIEDGRFLLIHFNNDGRKGNYDQFKAWNHSLRNPACICLGKFMPKAHQPIWFSPSKELLSTNDVPVGPKGTSEVATYPSITKKNGEYFLWYPDRKHFLLGKRLTKELFQELEDSF